MSARYILYGLTANEFMGEMVALAAITKYGDEDISMLIYAFLQVARRLSRGQISA